MDTFWNEIVRLAPLWWIIAVVIIYFGLRFYYTRFKKLEDKVEHADCKEHQKSINDNKSTIDIVKSKQDTLIEDVATIKGILLKREVKGEKEAQVEVDSGQFSMANSPRKLTDSGYKLYEISGGKKVLEEHLDYFFKLIDRYKPKTALEVETFAGVALDADAFQSDEMIPIKNYVYNNPKFEGTEVNYYTVCYVMKFPLRDKYLETHPEIVVVTE